MNRLLIVAICLMAAASRAQGTTTDLVTQQRAASEIINRFTGGRLKVNVELSLKKNDDGCDRYIYSATSDAVTVRASSGVAACRGFYDYVKEKGAGYCGWSGTRFEIPQEVSCSPVALTTQFRDHQYLNVVTYGYSLPYWDKARWDREIDWMALHGIDMPLMLVGAEQIYREVFSEMGLSKEEIDEWEVGPAHLPWFRMGNLAGNTFDGPLGEEWNRRQVALAHHLLQRMRALGMKPVCPAFGGFVPKAFTAHHSGTTEATGWNWIPADCPNYRLNPASAAFVEVGRRFLQKWEKEFGMGKYYLSDSFNEMEIPASAATLTQYGDSIYKSITQGSSNPEAVWVTQGWTFVYQSGNWGNAKFKALTKNIPDERFMVIYMSPEYGPDKCWEQYEGFGGKEWCYTMLPNMGGKTFLTGRLTDYAQTYLNKLYSSPMRGNNTGFGLTPEGIENNELLYELICDAGWTGAEATISLEPWMEQYANCRYGICTKAQKEIYRVLRNTVYNRYIDHPRFSWQVGGNLTGSGNAELAPEFYAGVDSLFDNIDELQKINSPLLEYELVELAALYVSGYIEKIASKAAGCNNDIVTGKKLIASLDSIMLDLDAALSLHPLYSLKRWEDWAQGMAKNKSSQLRNARNARRIVTIWYGLHTSDEPVQDYAARIWSGLVRDFYRPRLISTLKERLGLIPSFNRIEFENSFVASAPTLSAAREIKGDHLQFLAEIIRRARVNELLVNY
ncbi:MAG: alpha-N-acetylglucosaminidase [Bacteroidaceae bacterium]|nr:alpha-N-acetylglucosaminidase [Bacteroidaceae bacterium]